MRVRTSLHLLLLPAALLTAGCEDDESPFEPPAAEEPANIPVGGATTIPAADSGC